MCWLGGGTAQEAVSVSSYPLLLDSSMGLWGRPCNSCFHMGAAHTAFLQVSGFVLFEQGLGN